MLKENILTELSDGKTVSGQELAKKFSVSRNAVWKAVNSLKEEGYMITGANKAGYTLRGKDALTPFQLKADAEKYSALAGLPDLFDGLEIICLDEIDSTNNEAKRLAPSLKGNALITAGKQTAGRGRLGRSFYSPEKTGAYFTLALHGERELSEAVKFTSLAAVAVCRAIENLTGRSPLIKWVNDLYLDDKKICGILTEAVSDMESGKTSCVIIGAGVNLSTEDFPPEVKTAGSVGAEGLTRSALISAAVCEILNGAANINENGHIPYYRKRSYLKDKEIYYFVSGERREGVAAGIDDDGGLIVKAPDGETVKLRGGEVTVRVK